MNKIIAKISVMLFVVLAFSCAGNNTKEGSDTSHIPPVTDTMPVVHPKSMDSDAVVKPPPTHDSISIMPDSAIKNK